MGVARPSPPSDRKYPADGESRGCVPAIAGKEEFWEGSAEDLILCGARSLAREVASSFAPFRACHVFAFNPGPAPWAAFSAPLRGSKCYSGFLPSFKLSHQFQMLLPCR